MPRSPRAAAAYSMVGLGASLVVAAAAAWFLVPVDYEVFALLKVSEKPPSVLGKSPNATDEFAIFKRTQVQLIRSNMVLLGVLRDTRIAQLPAIREHNDDPVSWLNNQLVIDYPDDAEVLRIAMKGKRPDDLKMIVNKIVDVYMKEVIERDRDRRLEHEAKLERSHNTMTGEIGKQMDALRTLESLHKTSGSESAKLRKELALKELDSLLSRRKLLLAQLDENALAVFLAEAQRDQPRDAQTAEPAPGEPAKDAKAAASDAKPAENLSLPLLLKQKAFLEGELKQRDEAIARQVTHVESLESHSATVAQKAEDLKALQKISNELRGELDRVRIERLAPERVQKIDDAALAGDSGDSIRKYLAVSALAVAGLSLLVLGAATRPRRENVEGPIGA